MKRTDAFPSKYLKASDIEGDTPLKIKIVKPEILKDRQGQDEEKQIVYFHELEKGLVLNLTNWKRIESVTGQEDSDYWGNAEVVLGTEMVDAFGEIKPALRIKLNATSDPKTLNLDQATAFWTAAKEKGLTQEEGQAMINEVNGDIGQAFYNLV